MNTFQCDGCHQVRVQRYAELRVPERVWLCSRACVRAWLAGHPDPNDSEGAPE